jgi:hypothetical protein
MAEEKKVPQAHSSKIREIGKEKRFLIKSIEGSLT